MDDPGPKRTGQGRSGCPRVVLVGMRCAFTGPILMALASSPAIGLAAVVLPGSAPPLPRVRADPVLETIEANGLRLIEVPARADLARTGFRATLTEIAPDVIIVACFPWRLPGWMLALPPRGCLNLHPSLLPDGRGPEPVFWAFRRELGETGVTLHLMNEEFDAGPIISQLRVPIADGATIPSLENSLAEIGAGLALDYLRDASGQPQATPQPEEGTGYAPVPREVGLTVPTSWTAHRAARFISAVAPVYEALPVLVLATGQRLAVERVISVNDDDGDPRPIIVDRDIARVRFAAGTITCRILRNDHPLHLHI